MADRLYLILDSQSVPLANAVLESPPNSEVLQICVLGGKEEAVAAHREIQLIGMDDSTPNRVGVIWGPTPGRTCASSPALTA